MWTHTASHNGKLVVSWLGEENRKRSGRRRRNLGETRWSEEKVDGWIAMRARWCWRRSGNGLSEAGWCEEGMDGWVVCGWSSTIICMDS